MLFLVLAMLFVTQTCGGFGEIERLAASAEAPENKQLPSRFRSTLPEFGAELHNNNMPKMKFRQDKLEVSMNRLRETRTQKGISQIHLFSMTGIWPAIISYIERGYLPASPEQQEKISAALNVKRSWLFPKVRANSQPSRASFSSELPAIQLSALARK
jgi:ribosome-binding protein aMBF1 (putative translation factor)